MTFTKPAPPTGTGGFEHPPPPETPLPTETSLPSFVLPTEVPSPTAAPVGEEGSTVAPAPTSTPAGYGTYRKRFGLF